MDILAAVIAHFLKIKIFQDIQCLQHRGSLCPLLKFIYIDSLVVCFHRFFLNRFPFGQVFQRKQTALLPATPHQFLGNIAFIKAIKSRHDSLLSGFLLPDCLLLGFYHFGECLEQLFLNKDLPRLRSFSLFAQMCQQNFFTVGPFFDPFLSPLNTISGLCIDWIACCQLHSRGQYLLQAHSAILGQHIAKSTGCAGCGGG